MIYVESALEQLRNSLDDSGLKYEIGKLDERVVEISVIKNNVEIKVWFDVEKQIFGFDMLQGGCKTYSDFNEFEKFFATYLAIYTEFLPSAKAVADVFEKSLGINSIYDNFQGNRQTGYTAQFKVLGHDDKIILISKIPEGFIAKFGSYIDDNTKFKVISEYKYEVDEVNNVSLIPTIYSYMNELSRQYGDSEEVTIERTGVDEFSFTIEGLVIKTKVEFMYKEIKYVVSNISGYDVDFSCTLDDDPYKLSELYMICKDKYDDLSCNSDNKFNDDQDIENEFNDSDEVENEQTDENNSLEDINSDDFSSEDNYVNDISSENNFSNSVNDEDESIDNEETLNDTEVSMEFSIKTIIGSDGSIRSLQFVTDDDIYTMSVEKAKELGIPVERIDEHVSCVNKCGILVTEDEIARHRFSKDISNDDNICLLLFNSIFS